MKKVNAMFAVVLMCAVLFGCDDSSDSNNSNGSTKDSIASYSGKISNLSSFLEEDEITPLTYDKMYVCLAIYSDPEDDSVEELMANCSNKANIGSDGSFTINFIDPASAYLADFSDMDIPPTLTVSPSTGVSGIADNYELQLNIYEKETDVQIGLIHFNAGSDSAYTEFDYVNGDISITGSLDEEGAHIVYDVDYAKGWNWYYYKESSDTEATMTSPETLPSEIKCVAETL